MQSSVRRGRRFDAMMTRRSPIFWRLRCAQNGATKQRPSESGPEIQSLPTFALFDRHHAIRDEVTQILSLMNDSYSDEHSIFYEGPSSQLTLAPIDRRLVEMLSSPEVQLGMTGAD